MSLRWFGFAVLIALSVFMMAGATSSAGGKSPGPIEWHSWSSATFAKAKAENKLIFIDVGTEWCSACNAMDEGSYKNVRVHELLRKNYIAIHVDAEAEPDIGERYGFWGWPALVFMKPNGDHVHFVRGYMFPKDFIWLLNLLQERREKGELVKRQINVDLKAPPVTGPLDGIVSTARTNADRYYDEKYGGWGRARMASDGLVRQALWRARASGQGMA